MRALLVIGIVILVIGHFVSHDGGPRSMSKSLYHTSPRANGDANEVHITAGVTK